MKERDCVNCKHHSEDGCSSWDCEFEAKLPKGELISKADAIELLTEIVFDEPPYFDSETLCRLYAEEQINKLPSADAVQGEWIKTTSGNGWNEWYVLKCPCGAMMTPYKGGDDE